MKFIRFLWRKNFSRAGKAWESGVLRIYTYSAASEGPANGDEDTGADEAGDEITEPAGQNDSKHRKDGVGDDGADDSKKDVHENTHIAFHDLFGEHPATPPMIMAAIQLMPADSMISSHVAAYWKVMIPVVESKANGGKPHPMRLVFRAAGAK